LEIGLFQLENLTFSRNIFVFLDLRPAGAETPEKLATQLKSAKRIAPGDVEKHLAEIQHNKEQPLVLICADGKTSQKVFERLERAGYNNVCVVAGGVTGLLSEV
jgi:rhodanese-related sulfurtransferase